MTASPNWPDGLLGKDIQTDGETVSPRRGRLNFSEDFQVEDDPTNDATKVSLPGSLAGSVGALFNVAFVDPQTTATGNDGSIGKPYATLAAAMAVACTAGFDNTILLCPGDYSGEGTGSLAFTATGFMTHIMGLGRIPIKNTGSSTVAQLPGLTCSVTGSGTLFVERAAINAAVTRPSGTVCLVDVTAASTISCGVFHCDRCYLLDTVTVTSGTPQVTAVGTTFAKSGTIISSSSTSLSLTRCSFVSAPVIVFSGSAGLVTMDAATRAAFFAAGGSVTNGTIATSPQEAGLIACQLVTLPTSVGNQDTTILTVPASPSGANRFVITALEIRLETAISGSGNITLRVGTSTGGNELLLDNTAWTSSTTAGTLHGSQTTELGATFTIGTGYKAYLASGATVKLRATLAGATISAGAVRVYLHGYYLP